MAPYFSVVMPTHARPALLRRALASLRAQTFTDFEVIVVDDLGSAETAQAAAECLTPRDSYLRRSGKPGPSASRNLGLDLARGRWIVFLDDDDRFEPHHLAVLHEKTRASGARVLYCDVDVIHEDRSKPEVPELSRQRVAVGAQPLDSLWVKNFIPLHCLAYERSVLEGVRMDPHMASLEDWEFLLAVAERAGPVHYEGGGVLQHIDSVNHGLRRSTTTEAKNSLVVLEYLYTYRRRPAPTPAIRDARRALLRSVGLDLPQEWF